MNDQLEMPLPRVREPEPWRMVFWRYYNLEVDVCDDRREALMRLFWGAEHGELAPVGIRWPNGNLESWNDAMQKEAEGIA